MIHANCRDRFTAADFDFVVKSLSKSKEDSVGLVELLTDEEARDSILDHDKLLQALLSEGQLAISPQFYFYILIRHVLKQTGIQDRKMSDYLASLLETFSRTAGMKSPTDREGNPIQYISDMLLALRDAPPTQTFLIRAHAGNYSLFISGIFPENIQCRTQRRGGPDVSFYEDVGRTNYKAVANHSLARSWGLSDVYETLASQFHDIRLALNQLSDRLIHLDESCLNRGLLS